MNDVYKFRAELTHDCMLARSILSPWILSWSEVRLKTDDNRWLGEVEVTLEVASRAIPEPFFIWLLSLADDLHVVCDTFKEASAYTGERAYFRDGVPSVNTLYLSEKFNIDWYSKNIKVNVHNEDDRFSFFMDKLRRVCKTVA